jgi:hypothetical protein
MLQHRVANVELTWSKDIPQRAPPITQFDHTLDVHELCDNISTLNFAQLKCGCTRTIIVYNNSIAVPVECVINASECNVYNNSVTISWTGPSRSHVDAYVLEIKGYDDPTFKEAYTGISTMCTIDGLHFNTVYTTRVKAVNAAGHGPYSQSVCLQTAQGMQLHNCAHFKTTYYSCMVYIWCKSDWWRFCHC